MSENIRVENWCDHEIRFVEHEGNWYAVLKDICDALNLRTDKVKLRIDSLHITKLNVLQTVDFANQWTTTLPGGTVQKGYEMLCVDEAGIYQALSRSTRLEARKFIDWISHSLVDLRKAVGLEGYEALRLTDTDVQKLIADKIDISFTEPTGDLIPVETVPTVINQNITNVNVDYRKVALYAGVGVVGAIVLYHGVKYVAKKLRLRRKRRSPNESNTIHRMSNYILQWLHRGLLSLI